MKAYALFRSNHEVIEFTPDRDTADISGTKPIPAEPLKLVSVHARLEEALIWVHSNDYSTITIGAWEFSTEKGHNDTTRALTMKCQGKSRGHKYLKTPDGELVEPLAGYNYIITSDFVIEEIVIHNI